MPHTYTPLVDHVSGHVTLQVASCSMRNYFRDALILYYLDTKPELSLVGSHTEADLNLPQIYGL